MNSVSCKQDNKFELPSSDRGVISAGRCLELGQYNKNTSLPQEDRYNDEQESNYSQRERCYQKSCKTWEGNVYKWTFDCTAVHHGLSVLKGHVRSFMLCVPGRIGCVWRKISLITRASCLPHSPPGLPCGSLSLNQCQRVPLKWQTRT